MSSDITKIQINDIKYIVLEALNQINELSSKDWHDKYLTNIPEDVFYVVMGRDKKKTPIKELMFRIYFNELQSNQYPPVCQEKLLKIANDYNSLNAEETQVVNDFIAQNGVETFEEFEDILKYVIENYRYDDDFGVDISMYDKNCVKLYEDVTWLVLCPLTPAASRKCIAGNGNHWCTCSSSCEVHFPEYTYKSSSCLIAFLNKEKPEESFQSQIDEEGATWQICDYEDHTINSNAQPWSKWYKNFLNKLENSGVLSKLVHETEIRSQKKALILTPRQIAKKAVNIIFNLQRTTPNYWEGQQYYIDDKSECKFEVDEPRYIDGLEGVAFICNAYCQPGTKDCVTVFFMYSEKNGIQIVANTDVSFFYPTMSKDLAEYFEEYESVPLCYSPGKQEIYFLNKNTERISAFSYSYLSSPAISTIKPIPVLVFGREGVLLDFNGNQVRKDSVVKRRLTLPECWGGGKIDIDINFSDGKFKNGNLETQLFTWGILGVRNTTNNDCAIYDCGKDECLGTFHNSRVFHSAEDDNGFVTAISDKFKAVNCPNEFRLTLQFAFKNICKLRGIGIQVFDEYDNPTPLYGEEFRAFFINNVMPNNIFNKMFETDEDYSWQFSRFVRL